MLLQKGGLTSDEAWLGAGEGGKRWAGAWCEDEDAVVERVSADPVSPSKVTCEGGKAAGKPGTLEAGDCLVVADDDARRDFALCGISSDDMLRLLLLVLLLL